MLMEIEEVIKLYIRALEKGSYEAITKLFTEDAIVNSPLYGKIKASEFYKALFKDTTKSKITLLNIFVSKSNRGVGAGHFRYDWILKDRTPTSFECVDVFQFANDGKIKQLTIIYDTHKARQAFEKIKK